MGIKFIAIQRSSTHSHSRNKIKSKGFLSPQEELGVIHPLVDEMGSDGLRAVLEMHVVQSVDEQGWVVVQSGDGNLQAHGPQLIGPHPTHQTLQNRLHKQRDALQVGDRETCLHSR